MTASMKYIVELPWGYWVRFFRGTAKSSQGMHCYLQKTFPFSEHGGKRGAKAAAKQFRDQHLKEHKRITDINLRGRGGRSHTKARWDSSGGTPGVTTRTRMGSDGKEYQVFIAHWNEYNEAGKSLGVKSKQFRCDNYTSDLGAKRAAQRFRRKKVKENYPKDTG